MKRSILANVLTLALALSIGGIGCKHTPKAPTPIPGRRSEVPPVTNPNPPITRNTNPPNLGGGTPVTPDRPVTTQNLPKTESGTALANMEKWEDRPANREIFKAYTVYFDFDRSSVKPSEKSKLEAVADAIKKGPANHDLLIEGHCDERGTEEYNRALGERRALAIREYLMNLGLGAERVRTISYGKDKPVNPEHNDAAWEKNRRGEFLLLLPKP